MIDIKRLLGEFWEYKNANNIEIYNEFSLQHELGIFLRNKCPDYKVQFERNVSFFLNNGPATTKKEIDIVVYNEDKSEKYAIELKSPKIGNMRCPETMFDFIKDIAFMEELKNKSLGYNFTATFTMVMTNDNNYWNGRKLDGIYQYFRRAVPIHGIITKPTGDRDKEITINGYYNPSWIDLDGGAKYYILEIQ